MDTKKGLPVTKNKVKNNDNNKVGTPHGVEALQNHNRRGNHSKGSTGETGRQLTGTGHTTTDDSLVQGIAQMSIPGIVDVNSHIINSPGSVESFGLSPAGKQKLYVDTGNHDDDKCLDGPPLTPWEPGPQDAINTIIMCAADSILQAFLRLPSEKKGHSPFTCSCIRSLVQAIEQGKMEISIDGKRVKLPSSMKIDDSALYKLVILCKVNEKGVSEEKHVPAVALDDKKGWIFLVSTSISIIWKAYKYSEPKPLKSLLKKQHFITEILKHVFVSGNAKKL